MNNKEYTPDTRGTSEHLLKRYSALQGIRSLMESHTESLCKEFKRLIHLGPVFGLEIRNSEFNDSTLEQETYTIKDFIQVKDRFKYILCKANLLPISTITDKGLGKGALVSFVDGKELEFSSYHGFFWEGNSLEDLLNDGNVIYILDLFLGGMYRDSEGNFD